MERYRMASAYSIFCYVRLAPRPAWRDTGVLFLFTAVGALFPLLTSPVLLLVWANIQWRQFVAHAEFTLYTASILMSAMFLIVRDYKKDPFPNQARVDRKRVDILEKYVNTVDASFPTGVILAVDGEDAEYDRKKGTLTLRRDKEIAKIIDGQHRIAGLKALTKGKTFEVNVTVFVDADLEDQALMFATINLQQTKVSKSLAYNLF